MNFAQFTERLRTCLPDGTVLKNPGKGTSTIMWCDGDRICYQRGEGSPFLIELSDLFEAYSKFVGHAVSTNGIKEQSKRFRQHGCHRTFFFMALRQMGIIESIEGKGVAGNPFWVRIPANAT